MRDLAHPTVAEELVALHDCSGVLSAAGIAYWLPSPGSGVVHRQVALPPGGDGCGHCGTETALGTTEGVTGPWVIKPRHGRGRAISTSPMTRTRSPSWSRSSPTRWCSTGSRERVHRRRLVDERGRLAAAVPRWRLETRPGSRRWARRSSTTPSPRASVPSSAPSATRGRPTSRDSPPTRRRAVGARWSHRGQSAILGGLPLSIAAARPGRPVSARHARPRLEAERLGFLRACGCTATSPRSSRPCLRGTFSAPRRGGRGSRAGAKLERLVRYAAAPWSTRRSSRPGVASAERITTGISEVTGSASKLVEDLFSVHVGKVQIKEDQARAQLLGQLEHHLPLDRHLEGLAATGEEALDDPEAGEVVLCVEDRRGPGVPAPPPCPFPDTPAEERVPMGSVT